MRVSLRSLTTSSLLLALVTFQLINPANAAAPKAGATCTKAGATEIANGKKYTCTKSGKKLTWNKGVAVNNTKTTQGDAFAIYGKSVARVVRVSDDEMAEAIRIYHEDTHNMAEGAGAAPLAALIKDKLRHHDKACGVILCGGNIDRDWAATVLAGGTPELR
jgi:threonine dehydratase